MAEENVEYHIEVQNFSDFNNDNGEVMFVLDMNGQELPPDIASTVIQLAATAQNENADANLQYQIHLENAVDVLPKEAQVREVINVFGSDQPALHSANGRSLLEMEDLKCSKATHSVSVSENVSLALSSQQETLPTALLGSGGERALSMPVINDQLGPSNGTLVDTSETKGGHNSSLGQPKSKVQEVFIKVEQPEEALISHDSGLVLESLDEAKRVSVKEEIKEVMTRTEEVSHVIDSAKLEQNGTSDILKNSCLSCDYVSSDIFDLGRHKKDVHQEQEPFQCLDCSKAFKLELSLQIHMLSHETNPKRPKRKYTKRKPAEEVGEPYCCPLCSFESKSKKRLQNHIQKEHFLTDIHTCESCSFVCLSSEKLSAHMESDAHKNNEKEVCMICRNAYIDLKQHMVLHEKDDRPFMCTECGYRGKTKSVLKSHMIRHKTTNEFKCSHCNYKTKALSRLKRHLKIHDPSLKKFLCTQCAFSTHDSYEYKRHMKRVHSKNRFFTCRYCGLKVVDHQEMRLHHAMEHKSKDSYFCQYCSFSCQTKVEHRDHLQVHRGENRFRCHCGFSSFYKAHYVRHLNTHTDNKPFACPVCGKECREKINLERHMAIHSEKRPYKCPQCDYTCKIKNRLSSHMRTHQDVKPFACEICGHRTKFSANLKKHMYMHMGMKPFSCRYCSYSSSEKNKLRRHEEKMHKDKYITLEAPEILHVVIE